MRAGLLLRLAWRNLWRHGRRTVLTALGFAAGIFVLIFFLGLGDGLHEKMIETGIRLASGHVVVEPRGARERAGADLRLEPEVARAVRSVLASAELSRYLRGTAPRLYASGLLSSARNSSGVRVVGADPAREAGLSLLPERVVEGGFLDGGARTPPVVLGSVLARKLGVGVGGRVVLMTQAGAEIESQLLRVRGIFETGMADVDGHLVAMRLVDLQALLGRPGAISEQAIFLRRGDDAEIVRSLIAERLRRRPVAVLTWRKALPQLAEFIVIDDAGNYLFNAVLLVMVALGVLNTVLMAVLERRREFGLLAALGLRPAGIAAMVVAEGALLTALGAAVGLAGGLAAYRYFAAHGLDISAMSDASFTAAGVAIDTVVHFYLYPGRVRACLGFIALLGFGAALYPALRAAATPPRAATEDGA